MVNVSVLGKWSRTHWIAHEMNHSLDRPTADCEHCYTEIAAEYGRQTARSVRTTGRKRFMRWRKLESVGIGVGKGAHAFFEEVERGQERGTHTIDN